MTARMTLALLFIVPAAMAYPWPSTTDRWLLGIAAGSVVILFAWWRGLFVTTIIGRRLAMFGRRNHRADAHRTSEYTTVLLRADRSDGDVPLGLIASYVDRYGLRCDKVRITSRDTHGVRTTWIGLTLGAADNFAALRARSPRIPLRETAEVAGRRLANHLRETGWSVTMVDTADAPASASVKETWRGIRDESGFVAAYRITVDDRLAGTLDAVWAYPSAETWTALEFTNSGVAAVCAIRSAERPAASAPIRGLTPLRGRHRRALSALDPLSVDRLESTPVPFSGMTTLRWPVDSPLAIRT
jgi:type VII secretion protein EccE